MVFNKILKGIRKLGAKRLVVASAFAVAMVGAAGLGFATKQSSAAAGVRDDGSNPIFSANTNGGIGCLSAKECVLDLKQNQPGDIQTIHNHFGLSPSEYARFESTARWGKTFKNGDVYVDNQVVMSGANSLGRNKFNSARKPITIGGKVYYYSSTQNAFADSTDSIDTLVMFDKNGVVEAAIMAACGNPVWGNKVKPEFECKALNKKEVAKDTYDFTTTVHVAKGASVNKVVYDFGDGSAPVTETNPAKAVRHKYTKAGTWTAKVTVHYNLPGKQIAVPAVTKCLTQVTVTPPPAPFYSCVQVVPAARNDEKTKFRFTVKTSQGNGATLKDADFTVDGSSTVTGVTTKDEAGNIYKEYDFARDGKDHTVVVKVNFNVAGGVQSKTCEAKVTSGKTPNCTVPGKEHLPVDSPECKPDECKPGVPVGSAACEEKCDLPGKEHLPKNSPDCGEVLPAELPETGMGGVVGLFAGTSVLGAVAHRVISNRRNRDM